MCVALHRYLGDGPKLVRELFRVADECAPSIVFIGEQTCVRCHSLRYKGFSCCTSSSASRVCTWLADPGGAGQEALNTLASHVYTVLRLQDLTHVL